MMGYACPTYLEPAGSMRLHDASHVLDKLRNAWPNVTSPHSNNYALRRAIHGIGLTNPVGDSIVRLSGSLSPSLLPWARHIWVVMEARSMIFYGKLFLVPEKFLSIRQCIILSLRDSAETARNLLPRCRPQRRERSRQSTRRRRRGSGSCPPRLLKSRMRLHLQLSSRTTMRRSILYLNLPRTRLLLIWASLTHYARLVQS